MHALLNIIYTNIKFAIKWIFMQTINIFEYQRWHSGVTQKSRKVNKIKKKSINFGNNILKQDENKQNSRNLN